MKQPWTRLVIKPLVFQEENLFELACFLSYKTPRQHGLQGCANKEKERKRKRKKERGYGVQCVLMA